MRILRWLSKYYLILVCPIGIFVSVWLFIFSTNLPNDCPEDEYMKIEHFVKSHINVEEQTTSLDINNLEGMAFMVYENDGKPEIKILKENSNNELVCTVTFSDDKALIIEYGKTQEPINAFMRGCLCGIVGLCIIFIFYCIVEFMKETIKMSKLKREWKNI